MILGGRALAAVLALAVPFATAAKGVPRANWTQTYAVTADGGFRMGNPKAKFAVVEYGSLTCPHCRHFAETGLKPLIANYVRTGRASYEFRPFILNGIDLAATLVARCEGPAHFFPMVEQLYATQPEWSGKVGQLSDSEQEALQARPQGEMMVEVAKVSGLFEIASAHGIAPARAQACLKDAGAPTRLVKIVQAANARDVHGTPTFFVNGNKVGAYDWPTLEPLLKEAGG